MINEGSQFCITSKIPKSAQPSCRLGLIIFLCNSKYFIYNTFFYLSNYKTLVEQSER